MPDIIWLYPIFFISSFLSTGLGMDSAFLIPLSALFVGAKEAVVLVTLYYFCQNISRTTLFYKHISWKILKSLLISALPGVIIGSILFAYFPTEIFQKVLAICILFFIAVDLLGKLPVEKNKYYTTALGGLYGFVSGFTGNGNIVKAPFLLSLGLTKESYIATTTLAGFFMNAPKIIVYTATGTLTQKLFLLSLPFVLVALLGSFLGKKLLKHIHATFFNWSIYIVSGISAIVLLFQ